MYSRILLLLVILCCTLLSFANTGIGDINGSYQRKGNAFLLQPPMPTCSWSFVHQPWYALEVAGQRTLRPMNPGW